MILGGIYMQINLKKVKGARTLKDMSVEEVATKLGIDSNAYWRIESGKSQLKANMLIKLMNILEQPLEFFLDSEIVSSAIIKQSKELYNLLKRIDLHEHHEYISLFHELSQIHEKN